VSMYWPFIIIGLAILIAGVVASGQSKGDK
jgi:hypothetical protein